MSYWVTANDDRNKAEVKLTGEKLVLSNGLICREILFDGCNTASYRNFQTNTELIDTAYPDFAVSVDVKRYSSDDGFAFFGAHEVMCMERVPYKPSATVTSKGIYPPPGRAVVLEYRSEQLELAAFVRYELYDGAPVIMKQVEIKNLSETKDVCIDNIFTDVLSITDNRDTIFADSDFDSTTDFLGLEMNEYAKNYARFCYGFLEFAPRYRMNVCLGAGESVTSITAYELLFCSEYYENRLTEVRAMYRLIAPWCTDSVMFFHLISDSSAAIRRTVDQCTEVGLEMVIQSFGSGVNMESGNLKYLNRIKKAYDYAHDNGIRIGAYTLAYVKNYRPVRGEEALNHDGSGICRCLATEWAEQYMKNVVRFIDATGADAVEIDGPYGMMLCSGGKTHNHSDFTDSQYKQWKASVVDWYAQLKRRGVYINAPDRHYLNGSNRSGVGYEEIAFSEKRAEQLVTSRIYYYKGTFSKNPSQGWGFLPLNVYHGGGKNAMFFPTAENSFEFDWALAQITASGVWPTLRGETVYDSPTGKDILTKWVRIFKKYREVLNGYTVHFLPPRIDTGNPERTTCIDAVMNQIPYGDVRGFVMFFNQTDGDLVQDIVLPVFYTGLSSLDTPPAPFAGTKNSDVLYPIYGEEIAPLVIKSRSGESRAYITDKKVDDKPIAPLSQAHLTERKIVISENDENPEIFTVDSNGNVKISVSIPKMSYKWYVLRPAETDNA